MTTEEFKEKYTSSSGGWPEGNTILRVIPDETGKMTQCIFLKKEPHSEIHLCSVHLERPDACRAYKPSSLFLSCRNLWKAKWEKINNVVLMPEEMIIYILNDPPGLTGTKLKYRDVPVVMENVWNIKTYVEDFMPDIKKHEVSHISAELKCIRCGNCCIFRENIPLTVTDIKELAKFLNSDEETVRKEYTEIFTDWTGEKRRLKKREGTK